MTGPVETKTAAATAVPLVVSVVLGLAAWQHWFAPPPPAVTTSVIAVLTGAAAWLAPHTSRTLSPAEVAMLKAARAAVTDPVAERAAESERRWIEARKRGGYTGGMAAEDMGPPASVPSVSVPPAVQPPATTTGGTTP